MVNFRLAFDYRTFYEYMIPALYIWSLSIIALILLMIQVGIVSIKSGVLNEATWLFDFQSNEFETFSRKLEKLMN